MSFSSVSDYDNDYHDNDYHNNDNNHDNNHDNDNNNTSTLNKRSYKSEVWDYFEKVIWKKEQKTAKCIIKNCKKEFSCGSGGTTRPLWRHLESAHRIQYTLKEKYYKKKKKTQEECGTVEEIFKKVSFFYYFNFKLI